VRRRRRRRRGVVSGSSSRCGSFSEKGGEGKEENQATIIDSRGPSLHSRGLIHHHDCETIPGIITITIT